jgi:hypothetical protein
MTAEAKDAQKRPADPETNINREDVGAQEGRCSERVRDQENTEDA